NQRLDAGFPVAVGVPMGAGRVAVVSTSAVFTNDAIRVCAWGADVAVARVLEYVRPATTAHPRIVFDEFHHGFGAHAGSLGAAARVRRSRRRGARHRTASHDLSFRSLMSISVQDGALIMRRIRDAVATRVVGQDDAIEDVLVAFLARGHVLIEGVPGTAKT